MELFSPKNKKFQEPNFRARKMKKHTLKIFFIFHEIELVCSKTTKLLHLFL